jgi:hypothetical protein
VSNPTSSSVTALDDGTDRGLKVSCGIPWMLPNVEYDCGRFGAMVDIGWESGYCIVSGRLFKPDVSWWMYDSCVAASPQLFVLTYDSSPLLRLLQNTFMAAESESISGIVLSNSGTGGGS